MSARRGARILVVDDCDDDIELLRLAFARVGSTCEVTGVTTVTAARAVLADPTRRPDIVLLDWKMPGMDAPLLLGFARSERRLVGLPILVFSSSDDPSDVRAAYAAGATAYVLKPPGLSEYESFASDLHAFWCRPVLYPASG